MLKEKQKETLWVVKDVVLVRSGVNYGCRWKVEVIMTPMAMYYARVTVAPEKKGQGVEEMELVGMFADDERGGGKDKAEQAGYQKLSDMMPKPTEIEG